MCLGWGILSELSAQQLKTVFSQFSAVGALNETLGPAKIVPIHFISEKASNMALYPASVVESAKRVCLQLFHGNIIRKAVPVQQIVTSRFLVPSEVRVQVKA